MQVIALILSILAFLVGSIALILTIGERKRTRAANKALRKALVDYVDREAKEISGGLAAGIRERHDIQNLKVDKAVNAARVANARVDALKKVIKENKSKIEQLEQGCVPDFNEAMKAVNAVNEMNAGIAGIFGPLEALQSSRQEGK